MAWVGYRHSPVVDEPAHLAAGMAVWTFHRFDLYRVNPPLVRSVAALPVVLSDAQTDWRQYHTRTNARPEFAVGSDFVAANEARWPWYFTLARWACLPLSLLGGYVCYRWARDLFGAAAGLVALTLWCFSPNVIAYAALITPDMGATALGVAAGYMFWRWLDAPSVPRAVAAGMVLGLAELTKATWILLFGLWPVLWLVWAWSRPEPMSRREWSGQARQMAAILLVGLYALNLGYGFQGSFHRLGDYTFASRPLAGADALADGGSGGNRFAGSWLGELPVPLPHAYVTGIDWQKVDFERGAWSYLNGEWKFGGWWYFYLYALLVKIPLGTWTLAALVLVTTLLRRHASAGWRNALMLLAPAAVVLALVSSQTGFNHHVRYALPVLPFAFIGMARIGQDVSLRRRPLLSAFVAAALTWSVVSSLWVYPHSLSYFNELAGGPTRGHEHLIDSSIDWGQDLFYLERWLDEHPTARPVLVDLFGVAVLRHPAIRHASPPPGPGSSAVPPDWPNARLGPQPGWSAVSVTRLHDRHGRYDYLRHFRPTARAGYSIRIYHITLKEANRVRRRLGLPDVQTSSD